MHDITERPDERSALLALGRAALALEQACQAWEQAINSDRLTLAEGKALTAARERASQAYAAALKVAMQEGGEG